MRTNSLIKTCFLLLILTITLPLLAHDYYRDGGQTPEGPKKPGFWDKILKLLSIGGDPVHLKCGEYYLSTTDITIQGRVTGVAVERNYSSKSEYNSRFGYGWDMNYNMKVRKLHDPNTLVLLTGRNRTLDYTFDPVESKYKAPAGLYDYIVENQDGTYTLVQKHGTELDFDINGNLTEIVDRNGNSITFTYDSNGLLPLNGPSDYFVGQSYGLIAREYQLKTITDDLGRKIDLYYDENSGLLTDINDFAGRNFHYVYDANNDLREVRSPATDDYPTGLVTQYMYDPNHNLISVKDSNDDEYISIVYDSNDMVKQQTYGYGTYLFNYDPDSNLVTVTDREDFNTTTVYNETGNPISISVANSSPRAGEPASYTTQTQYDTNIIEVTRKIFPAGNYIDYEYDPNGNLLTMVMEPNDGDPNIVTTFTYEPRFDFIKTVTDPVGNITIYTYDYEDTNIYDTNVGNLMKITYPEVNVVDGNGTSVTAQPTMSFAYNDYGQMETVTAPDGIVTKYEYYTDANDANNYGKLWKVIVDCNQTEGLNITTEYKYDSYGNVKEVNDPNGDITQFAYNALNLLTKTTSPLNYTTNFSYNKNKKLEQVERDITDEPNQITSFTHDKLDHLKTVTNPLAYVTTYGYDKNEDPNIVIDAEDNNTVSVYDERGLLIKVTDANDGVTEYGYTPNGDINDINDANGNITRYEYDGFNRLKKVTNAKGDYRRYYYDKLGRVIKEIAYDNSSNPLLQKRTEYDALGRVLLRSIMADASSTSPINNSVDAVTSFKYDIASRLYSTTKYYACGTEATTYYQYDRAGRLISTIDPLENETYLVYDKVGRIIQQQQTEVDPLSDNDLTITKAYEYDSLGRLTKEISKVNVNDVNTWQVTLNEYDELDNLIESTLPDGVVITYDYDINRRLREKIVDAGSGKINQKTKYTYDKCGRQTSITGYADPCIPQTTSYEYDSLGRLEKATYPDGNYVEFTYNEVGLRTKRVDQRGIIITYAYDKSYNLIEKSAIGNEIDNATETFTYDGLGRMLTATKVVNNNTVSLLELVYNDLSHVTEVNEILFGGSTKTTHYTYDQAGLLTSITYPNGTVVNVTPDWSGRIDTLKLSSQTIAVYKYIGSNVAQRSYPIPSVIYQPVYDNFGRITSADSGTSYAKFNYAYDPNTNSIIRQTFDHRSSDPATDFSYDSLVRLTTAQYGIDDTNEIFTIDKLGNRTNVKLKDNTNEVYVVDTNTNRYTSIDAVGLEYDAAGNLTKDKNGYEYKYDYENRLVLITKDDNDIASFAYDAIGRRVRKYDAVAEETTLYYYGSGSQVLCEYDGSGIFQKFFVYGNGVDEVLLTSNGIDDYYYVHDHLNSPVALVNASGSVVERYEYDAYGNAHIMDSSYVSRTTSNYGNSYLFTGRILDTLDNGSLKIQYSRNRYYHPRLGRWLTQDPLGYVNGMSLYEYCTSNPVNLMDPYGLCISSKAEQVWDTWSEFVNNSLVLSAIGNATIDALEYVYDVEILTAQYGEQAANYWTARGLASNTWYGKTGNYVMGGLASLWTPETYLNTMIMLGGGLIGGPLVELAGGSGVTALAAKGIIYAGLGYGAYTGGYEIGGGAVDIYHGDTMGGLVRIMGGVGRAGLSLIGAYYMQGPKPSAPAKASSTVEAENNFNYDLKIQRQLGKRGWSDSLIDDTISRPHATSPSINKATGIDATAYFRQDGSYIVRENVTNEIIQISNRNSSAWIPDSAIQKPYKP
jgi:RHS repeat-associated protein